MESSSVVFFDFSIGWYSKSLNQNKHMHNRNGVPHAKTWVNKLLISVKKRVVGLVSKMGAHCHVRCDSKSHFTLSGVKFMR